MASKPLHRLHHHHCICKNPGKKQDLPLLAAEAHFRVSRCHRVGCPLPDLKPDGRTDGLAPKCAASYQRHTVVVVAASSYHLSSENFCPTLSRGGSGSVTTAPPGWDCRSLSTTATPPPNALCELCSRKFQDEC